MYYSLLQKIELPNSTNKLCPSIRVKGKTYKITRQGSFELKNGRLKSGKIPYPYPSKLQEPPHLLTFKEMKKRYPALYADLQKLHRKYDNNNGQKMAFLMTFQDVD